MTVVLFLFVCVALVGEYNDAGADDPQAPIEGMHDRGAETLIISWEERRFNSGGEALFGIGNHSAAGLLHMIRMRGRYIVLKV